MSSFDQQDLDYLSRELKDFTEGLRKFTPKLDALSSTGSSTSGQSSNSSDMSANFDKSTQKIVNALGNLGAELTKNNRSEAQKTKYLEEFNKTVEKSTKIQEEAAIATAKIAAEKAARDAKDVELEQRNAAVRANQEERRRKSELTNTQLLKESVASASKEYEEFSSKTRGVGAELTENEKNLTKFNKGMKIASAIFDVLSKAVTGYTTSIYNNERGAKVAAKAMTDLVKPGLELADAFSNAAMALSFFMPGGLLVKAITFVGGLALKLFTKAGEAALKYNELAAEQGDKLHKSFMELSKGGVSLAGGMTETFNTMQEFGMSVAEATEFTSMLAGSAKDLKFLGATAGQGAKAFAEVAGKMNKSDVGRQLELMGVSAEEQRESALKYMAIQARTGQLQTKNTADLVKSSAAFTKEMDLAAELAGNTRKEQMEAREAALTDDRFAAAMDEAVKNGDKDRIAELEKASAMAAQLKASGDEQGATGVLQLAASRGAMPTEAAIAAQMQYGASDFIFNKSKTKNDIGEIMGGMAANADAQNASLNSVNTMTGNIAGMQTTGVGSRTQVARDRALKAAMEEQGFKGTRDEYLQTEQGKKIVNADSKTAAQTDLLRAQKNTALQMDKVVESLYDVSNINKKIATTMDEGVKKLTEIAKAMGVKIDPAGGKSGGFTTGPAGTSGAVTGTPTSSVPPASMPKSGSTGGGAATGNPSMSVATTQGNSNIRPGGGRAMAAKANAERAGQAPGGSSSSPTGDSSSSPQSITSDKKQYFDKLYAAILPAAKEAGISSPESIATLGAIQSALETGWGKSLAGGNNYFGIKGSSGKKQSTQEFIDGKMVTIEDSFRGYGSMEESAADYVKFLTSNKRYGSVLSSASPLDAIEAQSRTGYATDPDYGSKLKSIYSSVMAPAKQGARTGGIFKGPSTGYNVELHGDEAVVPMNEGVSKQALNTSVFNQDTSMINDLMSMFETMQYKYDQMIDLLSRQADNGDKLVQATC